MRLEAQGYEVTTAADGLEALEKIRAQLPDLVLLDVMMPDLDGGDAAAQIRGDPLLRDVPIVFLTAAVKKEELKGLEGMIGGFPYIAKPLNIKGVMSVIEKHLAK